MNNVYEQIMTMLYAVWRKRWYGLAAMWAVCLVGWVAVAMIPNQYESNARIYAKWSSLLPDKLGIGSGDKARQVDVVRQTLTSRPNLEKVVRRTGLDQSVEDEKELDGLISELAENITVKEQDGDLFTLTYVSSDSNYSDAQNATMAQRVVQNLINIFVEENISSDRDNINQAIRFLEDQLASRGRELEDAERRRADFEQKYLGRLPGQGNISERMMAAQVELDRVSQDIVQQRSSLGALQAQLRSTPATIDSPAFVMESAGFNGTRYDPTSARGRIEQLERSISDAYARGWTDKHPDVVTARAQIAALRRQADREPVDSPRSQAAQANPVYVNLRSLVFDKQSSVAALGARQAQLQRSIAEMQTRQVEEPGIAAEQAKLNRDYDVLRRQYDQLVKSREEVRLSSDVENKTDQVRFQIVDPPAFPRKPVAPNRPLLLTSVLIGGLLAGIATAFLVSQVHTTYITPNRLQEAFGVPVLGSVSEVVGDQQRAQARLWSRGFAVLAVGLVTAYAMLLLYQVVIQGAGA
jgi:polysaccharide chain length determinant protein (PEP-CTERM system associated)